MGVASWSALARRRLVGQGGLIAAGRAASGDGRRRGAASSCSSRSSDLSPGEVVVISQAGHRCNVPRVAPWRSAGKVHAGSPRRSFIRELENLI